VKFSYSEGETVNMTTRNSTLVGVFNERAQAENAIEQLHNAGLPDEQISYSGGSSAGGGFLAGIKSLFTGEDATNTSLVNDLTGMGLSQDEANYYDNEYRQGRYIVAVNPGNRWQDAQTILNSGGAYNYASRSSAGTYGQTATTGYDTASTGYATSNTGYATDQTTNTGYDTANAGYATAQTANTYDTANTGYTTDQTANTGYADSDEAQRVRLREERLNVDKQPVQSGEARLRKDVVEEQQNVDVPVNREEVIVQRQSYGEDRPTDAPLGQDETIRVPVSEEQVNVNKQTVETGEVGLGKRVVQDQQRVSDTVRREEAHLETDGDPRVRDANDPNTTYNNPDPNYNNPDPNQGNY
jgi:uncharacterized protein (TIGR02271 family)